ncbi:MAG: integrase arm-type DNA-binding domain-containing protein [Pseudomonadales bacterium]|nr:integrase arm-type DNA-binding domain-containing protein [Pseudomonadales bacterium]
MQILTDNKVRSLVEPGKYSDGKVPGLFLKVGTTSKLWRLKYRLHGKEGLFAIGSYPDVSIAKAREIAQEARSSVANGVAPLKAHNAKIEARKATDAMTFRAVAEKYLKHRSDLVANSMKGHRLALKNHIFPVIGDRPVTEVKVSHIAEVIDNLGEKRVMAQRVLGLMKSVLAHAEVRGYIDQNVAAGRHKLLKPVETTNHKAFTDPVELRKYLEKLDTAKNGVSVLSALRMLVVLPVRPGELVEMRWEQVDLDAGEWRYVVSKTARDKKRGEHIVPLPTQVVSLLRELKERAVVDSKGRGWVLPSPLDAAKPIGRDALLAAQLNGLGYDRGTISTHGFRATFRTMARKHLKVDVTVLELMLSHKMPGTLSDTYDRDDYLPERREAAQKWADYLDGLHAESTAKLDQ